MGLETPLWASVSLVKQSQGILAWNGARNSPLSQRVPGQAISRNSSVKWSSKLPSLVWYRSHLPSGLKQAAILRKHAAEPEREQQQCSFAVRFWQEKSNPDRVPESQCHGQKVYPVPDRNATLMCAPCSRLGEAKTIPCWAAQPRMPPPPPRGILPVTFSHRQKC